MKKLLFFLGAAALIVSCSDDNGVTPEPESAFEYTLEGESPNAVLTLTNKSVNASSYRWLFSEGGSMTSSVGESPIIKVDKTGEFTIQLFAFNGDKRSIMKKTLEITGKNGINEYSDIEFGSTAFTNVIGNYFSTSDGRMYKDDELNPDNGALIDLVYVCKGGAGKGYYASPNDTEEDYIVPSAKATKIKKDVDGTLKSFEDVKDETPLKTLKITSDIVKQALQVGDVVLFENGKKKTGAIKVKTVSDNKIVVDIKVQKY